MTENEGATVSFRFPSFFYTYSYSPYSASNAENKRSILRKFAENRDGNLCMKGGERGDLFKFPPYKSLQQEREEIGKGVEVSVEADVLVTELYPVFYFWVFAVSSCKFGERLSGIVCCFHFYWYQR